MSERVRYSVWDGTQSVPELDPEDVMAALSDDLLNHGDLDHALRNLMQRGMRGAGMNMRGVTDLVRQLREERRKRLERYDLGGIMQDIERRLKEVLELERGSIDELANKEDQQAGKRSSKPSGKTNDSAQPKSGKPSGNRSSSKSGAPQTGDPQGAQSGGGSSSEGGDDDMDPSMSNFMKQFSEDLSKNIAADKREFLDQLPQEPASQVRKLQDYEFLNQDAQKKFNELIEQLRQAMTKQFFKNIEQMVQQMSAGDIRRMKEMMRDLNEMLAQRIDGQEPDFDKFMEKYGDMFGANPPKSLDELLKQMQEQMAAMQSLMASMSPEQREQLQQLFSDKFGDPELEVEMMRLAQRMDILSPDASAYPFRGDQPVDLQQAMSLMGQMQDIDELAREMQRLQYGAGDMESIDVDKLRELLGDDAAKQFDQMKSLRDVLEKAGFIRNENGNWELTPRGTRKIGQKTLGEIYSSLKAHSLGNHPVSRDGRLGERTDDTKLFEFGDPFHLHMTKTLRNALEREGRGSPIKLTPADFEIYRTELITKTATVLMIDLSWSMARRGAFHAAKKVALALHQLISSQFPRDSLYLVGFSAYARELKAHELPQLHWDEYMLGTNIQHALQIGERLLARHQGGTKQIIMISDGEPTSHMEDGVAQFAYPPSPITIRETLKAVRHCTKRNITVNTFMLDQNYYLKEFVEAMTRINGGRAFYTTPEQLGEYILVDYVTHKKKKIGRSA